MNVSEPLYLSNGILPDQVLINMKKPDLFISAASGEPLDPDNVIVTGSISTQVPKGVDVE